MLPRNVRTKRSQGQLRDFEILQSEGNADDRSAEKTSKHQVRYCQLQSGENDPQNIDDEGDRPTVIFHFLTEGIQRYRTQLEALPSNRYSHDRNTPEAAGQDPSQRTEEPSEYDPPF